MKHAFKTPAGLTQTVSPRRRARADPQSLSHLLASLGGVSALPTASPMWRLPSCWSLPCRSSNFFWCRDRMSNLSTVLLLTPRKKSGSRSQRGCKVDIVPSWRPFFLSQIGRIELVVCLRELTYKAGLLR